MSAPMVGAPPLRSQANTLEAIALRLEAGTGRRARLIDVSLSFASGTVTALVGPNGAGKSSLLQCLSGIVRPQAGEVRLGGKPISRLDRHALARSVAMVGPWSAADVDLTVAEVVGLGRLAHRKSVWQVPDRADRDAVHAALRRTDLLALVDVPLRTLSSGERQRVRLGAALAQGAPFLLLDEPTASLDPGHSRQMLDLARGIARDGSTVVLALHDLTAAGQYADRVALLAEGRVAAQGAVDDVLRGDLLGDVYRTPLTVVPHPQTGRPMVVADYRSDDAR